MKELGGGDIGDTDLADFGCENEGGHCMSCLVIYDGVSRRAISKL